MSINSVVRTYSHYNIYVSLCNRFLYFTVHIILSLELQPVFHFSLLLSSFVVAAVAVATAIDGTGFACFILAMSAKIIQFTPASLS